MDPVSHGALAYLLYVAYALITTQRLPIRWTVFPLAVASQLPDLIDKPLAYWGVLAYGRSLAHSVFTMAVICTSVWWLWRSAAGLRALTSTDSASRATATDSASRITTSAVDLRGLVGPYIDRLPSTTHVQLPAALSIGYLAHLLGDSWSIVLRGAWSDAQFLLYPIYPLSASPADDIAPWIRLLNLYREPAASMHLEIVTAAVLVFIGLRIRAYRRRTRLVQRSS